MITGTGIAEAKKRGRRLYPRSTSFQGAYVNGARAALHRRPVDDCPYMRRGGWQVWRRAWLLGFESAHVPDDEEE